MLTGHEMRKIRRKKLAGRSARDFLLITGQPVEDLPLRQYAHTRSEGGGLDSTCVMCSSVVGTNTDELSLLASEREHVCRGKIF